jgi:2-desacetyl-2-hydroxyethyl bacteriochlorophyllide A dehydrogenase
MMKAAVFRNPGDMHLEEVPEPVLEKDDVLVRVRACGICGSDLHTYKHGLFEDLGAPMGTGRVLGHEFSGEIAKIKGNIEGLNVGDRICTIGIGANAEYICIPSLLVPGIVHIPDHVSFEEAATTEPLATSLHAVNLANPVDGETHVIIGAGIIGLGVLQVLKTRADIRIIVVDISDKRLQLAIELGADITINAGREKTLEKIFELCGTGEILFISVPTGKVDTVYDCAGLSKSFTGTPVLQQAISMLKENGKAVVVAVYEKSPEIDFNVVVRKGITICGSWGWLPEEFVESLEFIASGKIDRKPLISHRFSIDKAKEAFETQLKAEEAIKVMIIP